jgi:hypothetical protein
VGGFVVGLVPACCIFENAKEEEVNAFVVAKMMLEPKAVTLWVRDMGGFNFRWTTQRGMATEFCRMETAKVAQERLGGSILDVCEGRVA